MARPRVDVVVPYCGGAAELAKVRARLEGLRLDAGDTIIVVDNTPDREPGELADGGRIRVLRAAARSTPGFARNIGAAQGCADWVVFIDADTEPAAELLDLYFDPHPGGRTGLIAGGVIDEVVPVDGPAPARYAYLRGTLNHDRTLGLGKWGFAQTANVACRRSAFEAIGGFREDIWPAEDAEFSYRLKAGGWEIEVRERAAVVHLSRRTVGALIKQAARHGAGIDWLDCRYPGAFPARRRPGLVWWAVRTTITGLLRAARGRDRDGAVRALFDPLWEVSFEFGRSLSIERPRRRRLGNPRSMRR